MALCFVDPADAIRAMADSIGREARRQLLGEAVRAWVDEIPDTELEVHYAKAISELDEHDLSMLAAWHGSLEVGHPVPNRDFLMGAFGSLGENRREALKLAAGFRGEEAVDAGVTEEDALELVLGLLSPPRQMELALEAVELSLWDRGGSDNWPPLAPHDGVALRQPGLRQVPQGPLDARPARHRVRAPRALGCRSLRSGRGAWWA